MPSCPPHRPAQWRPSPPRAHVPASSRHLARSGARRKGRAVGSASQRGGERREMESWRAVGASGFSHRAVGVCPWFDGFIMGVCPSFSHRAVGAADSPQA
eukprot:7205135-Prymnesium_polylepis.1